MAAKQNIHVTEPPIIARSSTGGYPSDTIVEKT
jgi:hypothetical protein